MTPSISDSLCGTEVEEARAFLDFEAHLLDRLAYHDWLDLWSPDGRYIVPIDRELVNFEDRLNNIYDDTSMRRQRVERLLSGHAPSAMPIMRTVRSVSRVRVLENDRYQLHVASSLLIVCLRREVQTLFAADVTHKLVPSGNGFLIAEKIVLPINSDEALTEMSYLP